MIRRLVLFLGLSCGAIKVSSAIGKELETATRTDVFLRKEMLDG